MKYFKPLINFVVIPIAILWTLSNKPLIQGLAIVEFIRLSVESWLSKRSSKGLIGIPMVLLCILCFSSCKKQDDFLDKSPDVHLSVIRSLQDCQLLLRNTGLFNSFGPSLHFITGEEFYATDNTYSSLQFVEQNAYTFAAKMYPNSPVADWDGLYQQVYTANVVLDALAKLKYDNSQQTLYDQLKGTALFFRARAYFILLQIFALPYDSSSAKSLLGIPLRYSSDLNQPSERNSQDQCYRLIIGDLKEANELLPSAHIYFTDPTKVAANAMLAKVYLYVEDYNNALLWATNSLSMFKTLTDYNGIVKATTVITRGDFLSEDIFHSVASNYTVLVGSRKICDSTLFAMYDSNDLRKKLFYTVSSVTGLPYFSGSYETKNSYLYDGVANDEVYLIRAEAYARLNQLQNALDDLNYLLSFRYKTGTFTPFTINSQEEVLKLIITERRKELTFRGVRWGDLKRLNKDSRFATNLHRVVKGVDYFLPSKDNRYAFLFPDAEIQLTGMPQNPR